MKIFRKTVDIIISDFDRVIKALETHAEEKTEEIKVIEENMESLWNDKNMASLEKVRAVNISNKLKEIFKNV